MAKIPVGNFGFRTPQGPDVTPTAQPDMQVGDAIARVGAQTMATGAQMLHEQDQLNKQAAARADHTKTVVAHVNIQTGLADQYDAINADVKSGKLDKLAATALWKDTSQKIISDNIATAPADRAPELAAQAKGVEGGYANKLYGTFRLRDDQDAIAGVGQAEEGLQRLAAGGDLQGAIKQQAALIDGSPLPIEQKAVRKQKFVETAYYNDFRRQAQGAMQTGTTEALDQVQQRLAGTEGDVLDPAKRNALDQTIFGWKQSIEARNARDADRAERDATKRFNTATDTINKNRDIALGGGFIAPDQIALIAEQTQGIPELQAQARELFDSQKQVAGFASRSPAERAAVLEDVRARRANPAVGIDPLGQKQLERAEQIDSKLRQQVDNGEAWSAAQSVGVVKSAPQLDISNPAAALQVFQQRMGQIGEVEAWAGKKISPLQPVEAEQMTKVLRALPPAQAASMLGQIGQVIGDADRIAALGKQIGDKDGVLGMAIMLANNKTDKGNLTAERLLEGAQNIRDKTVKVDGAAETGWRSEIAKQIRGAYSNAEVEQNMIEAAFLVRASNAFKVDNDSAVNMVTGGIVERNGGRIPLPSGMKESDFEKKLGTLTPEAMAGQAPNGFVMAGPARIPVADFVKTLPDARLVHAGQGLYNVRAGNQLVTNERGQRITLKVSP